MLNIDSLTQKLKDMKDLYRAAYVQAFLQMFDVKSDIVKQRAEEFADNMLLNHDQISEALASAIDYYVRSIGLSGTIITQGSPSTQTATISFQNMNSLNGVIPNTLGIN